jgi:cell shape-determining protein MreC
MKMIYHSRTKKPVSKLLLFFLLIILFIGTIRLVFPEIWSRFVMTSAKPFLMLGNSFYSIRGSNSDLKRENEILKSNLYDRNLLAEENAKLRELLGRREDRNSIVAVVLSKPTFTPYDTFVIDVGSNNGIAKDALVMAGSGTALGRVTEIYPSISKVTAFSSPNVRNSVFIGANRIQVEAIGQGNGNFKIVMPEGSEINPGDEVVLPNIVPTVFGIVERVVPGDQPSFINVLFKSPVNLSELYYVEIIL